MLPGSVAIDTAIQWPIGTDPVIAIQFLERAKMFETDVGYLFDSSSLTGTYGRPYLTSTTDLLLTVPSINPAMGYMVPGSAEDLGLLSPSGQAAYEVTVAVRSGSVDGVMEGVVLADYCNPYTLPQYFNITVDISAPSASFSVESKPTLGDSRLILRVIFSEPVFPLSAKDLTITGGTLQSITMESETASLVAVEGSPGKTVSVVLNGAAIEDYAGNAGLITASYNASIPSSALATTSKALRIASAVAIGVSSSTCLATATIVPGWSAIACGAAVLRSFGHLQFVALTVGLAADLPASYDIAAGSADWCYVLDSWGLQSSRNYVIGTLNSPPPPTSAGVPIDPFVLTSLMRSEHVHVQYAMSWASKDTSSLTLSTYTNFSISLRYDDIGVSHRDEILSVWDWYASAVELTGFAVVVAVLIHMVVTLITEEESRLAGEEIYCAFPKLLLVAFIGVLPAWLYASVQLLSWEAQYANGESLSLPIGLLIPAVVISMIVYIAMLFLTGIEAQKKVQSYILLHDF
eukprot:gene14760-20811_t